MKFPRRAKLLRNPLDATAYAGVFFLLVLFVAFGSRLYTPGVKIVLPTADNLPGTDKPTVTVAMDQSGRFYFQNQIVEESALKIQLLNFTLKITSLVENMGQIVHSIIPIFNQFRSFYVE